jgi:hyperosmotically inducible periplasmic protein
MRYIWTTIISLFLLTAVALAQITALPQNRQKLGGTDPTARISREVMHELLMDPYYSLFDNLAFKVDGNTVTLYGQVVNPVVKSDAESAVRHIEGVEKVVDNIEVLPLSPNDNRIRHAAYLAIYGFPNLSRYDWGAVPSIHIIVKNGNITLTGVVDNESDKNVAGLRANTVPGAFSVKNDLEVVSTTAKNQKPPTKPEKKETGAR